MSEQQAERDVVQAAQSQEPSLRQPLTHRARRSNECRICFGQHDEAIHAATLSIREWHRGEVRKYLEA